MNLFLHQLNPLELELFTSIRHAYSPVGFGGFLGYFCGINHLSDYGYATVPLDAKKLKKTKTNVIVC